MSCALEIFGEIEANLNARAFTGTYVLIVEGGERCF
jgi:hypothetical protein